jgi:hypothetical protein
MKYDQTKMQISWFNQRRLEKALKLNPPFQRKPVWTDLQRSALIETILLDLPIPEVFIQQETTPEGKTLYIVVDGQQRIRSILEFIGDENEPGYSLMLEDDPEWAEMSFSDLTDSQKTKFWSYWLSARILDDTDEKEIRDMFSRLNKNAVPLNKQELRNATYWGHFITLASDLAEEDFWAENRIVTPKQIRRMLDIEFVSELLIGVMHGPQGKRVIDDYYRLYEVEFPDQASYKRRFHKTLELIQETLPDIKATRWRNKNDFYTLFVTVATLLKDNILPEENYDQLAGALKQFADDVRRRIANEDADVSEAVAQYVPAVQRGTTDKARRGARHEALLSVISEFFRPRRGRKNI